MDSMPTRTYPLRRVVLGAACVLALTLPPTPHADAKSRGAPALQPVKVLIISMFGPGAQPWIDTLALTEEVAVPGLSADYPKVLCNADDVCQLTTGMGHTNAAASVAAVVFSGKFDLKKTYFLVAGIAGIH